jgi:arginyl-tRNA synthetase
MIQAKQELLAGAATALEVAPGAPYRRPLRIPKQAAHGDLAITAAMALAKA